MNCEKTPEISKVFAVFKRGSTASRLHVAHLSSASAKFLRFRTSNCTGNPPKLLFWGIFYRIKSFKFFGVQRHNIQKIHKQYTRLQGILAISCRSSSIVLCVYIRSVMSWEACPMIRLIHSLFMPAVSASLANVWRQS